MELTLLLDLCHFRHKMMTWTSYKPQHVHNNQFSPNTRGMPVQICFAK